MILRLVIVDWILTQFSVGYAIVSFMAHFHTHNYYSC